MIGGTMATQDGTTSQTNTTDEATSPLTVNIQYLKDATFENPNPIKAFQETGEAPEISVGIDVRVDRLADKTYEIALHISTEALRKDEKLFVCEVEYAGIFTLDNLPEEAIQPILMIECPRIL